MYAFGSQCLDILFNFLFSHGLPINEDNKYIIFVFDKVAPNFPWIVIYKSKQIVANIKWGFPKKPPKIKMNIIKYLFGVVDDWFETHPLMLPTKAMFTNLRLPSIFLPSKPCLHNLHTSFAHITQPQVQIFHFIVKHSASGDIHRVIDSRTIKNINAPIQPPLHYN